MNNNRIVTSCCRRRNPSDWTYNNIPQDVFIDRGFTGHEHLDQFNLINMNGRIYDPLLAMFLSPDNYVQSPDLTLNFNRYSYALNNPLVFTDPTGNTRVPYPRELGVFNYDLGPVATGRAFMSNGTAYTLSQLGIHVAGPTYGEILLREIEERTVTGTEAQSLFKAIKDGLSIYEYDVYNRISFVASMGDPGLYGSDNHGYNALNPTATFYPVSLMGGYGIGVGSTMLINDISFNGGLAFQSSTFGNELIGVAANSAWTTSVKSVAINSTEAAAQKVLSGIVRTTKYLGWAGNIIDLSANGINVVNHWNSTDEAFYNAKAIGSGIIVGLNGLNFIVPGLGTTLSIAAGVIDATGGFDFIYNKFR